MRSTTGRGGLNAGQDGVSVAGARAAGVVDGGWAGALDRLSLAMFGT